MKRRKIIATVVTVLALTLSGSVALAQSKASIKIASPDEEVVLEKQFICFAGLPCNIELKLDLPVSKSVATVPLQPKVVVEQIQRRTDRVHSLVKYVILPAAGAAAGAGIFSAKWPTKFDGVNNTLDYGSAWKGALIGAGVGLVMGVIVDLLDN